MITDVQSDRMVILSDLHLGNPFSKIHRKVVQFLLWASQEGFDICLNGDALEIAQVDPGQMVVEVPPLLQTLKAVTTRGSRVFYVVGNHDIFLEHFLTDFQSFKVAPFLNVSSGGARVRVEHGHLYDPFFVRNPDLYEWMTSLGGWLLRIQPRLYRGWIAYEKRLSQMRLKRGDAIVGENPSFCEAALELCTRGFDHVVFGHTHHAGQIDLGQGHLYLNPGSWMLGSSYVLIDRGRVSLEEFRG